MRRWGTATKWLISTLIIAAQPRAFGHFDTLRPLWTRIARRLTYPPSHACTGRPSRLPRAHLPGGAGSRRPARLARVHRLRDRRGEGCKLSVTVVTRHDVACQDEPVVVRALAFVVVQRVVGLVGLGPSSDDKDVEIAVLRHQLLVLRRRVARPRYTPADRTVLAGPGEGIASAPLADLPRHALYLAALHRELVRRRWTYPHTGRRPPRALRPDVVEVVVRLAREKPAGDTCASSASAANAASAFRRHRCARSCASTVSGRHRGAAGRAGPSSCAPRLPGCSRVIS